MLEWIQVVDSHPVYWAAVVFYGLYPILTSLVWMVTAIEYYRRRDRLLEESDKDADCPFVSVLVPAYCEEQTIKRALEGLVRIDYPHYEVIVVNDGSVDRTVEKVQPFLSDPRVRLIDKRVNEGKAMALNDGIPCCRGDLVVIMDADSVPDPQLIHVMVPHFRSARVAAVAGNPRVRNRSTVLAKLQAVEFTSVIGLMRRSQRVWGRVMCVSGVVGMFRKSALVDVGMYTPGMATEDIDLTWKLQMKFYDVRFEGRAMVWMLVPETLGVWWAQRRRWALGLGQVLRRHVRVIGSWKLRRMYPLYVESSLSVLWALTFVAVTAFWILSYSLGHPPRGGSPIPNLWGTILFSCCLLQLACGVWVDSRYEPDIVRDFPVSILYPSLYWFLTSATSSLYATRGLLSRIDVRAPTRWSLERPHEGTG